MTTARQKRWRAFVATLICAVLVLQAALASLAPRAYTAAAVDELAAHALCLGAAPGRVKQDGPTRDKGREQACCILCVVPGLAATAGPAGMAAPGLDAPLAAPLHAPAAAHRVVAFELFPIRARAPPAA